MSVNLEIGILGLPNVGKSALFNAMTNSKAEASNYPFSTITPNVGLVEVPDERLWRLSEMYKPRKTTPTAIKFVDIAGLAAGAASGEGLGNKFLSHIRQVDAVAHVVRCFEDENVPHPGGIDPLRDIDTINTELCLADLETIEKRIDKAKKQAKGGDPKAKAELEVLDIIKTALEDARPARTVATPEMLASVKDLFLLTLKPTLFVANIGEYDANNPDGNIHVQNLKTYAQKENSAAIAVCAKLEGEIAELSKEEAAEFLTALSISESGLAKLINASYELLGLMTFFTAGDPEVRAWTISHGTKAPAAAGKIHSDIERGFIRAEIVSYNDLMTSGSHAKAKEKGLVRLEGKEYIMKDADVTYFRFNV
jgi:GTP-binding protein YchF